MSFMVVRCSSVGGRSGSQRGAGEVLVQFWGLDLIGYPNLIPRLLGIFS